MGEADQDKAVERFEQGKVAMITGTRFTNSDAVAGGPTSNPKTSSVPTVWNEPTTESVIRTSRATWARSGLSPRSRAFCSLKDRARKCR